MATREAAAKRERIRSAAAKEIGPSNPVKYPARRRAGLKSLRKFLKSYFPWAFPLPWSNDHLRIIAKIEEAARGGGLFAFAMPRGAGKTTICERAAIWIMLSGLHRYMAIVAASEKHSSRILENIKTELRLNDLLAEDFPEACHPIRALNNEARRCIGQTWLGVNTSIGWGQAELTFPLAPPGVATSCAGSIVSALGITASLRGQSKTLATGEVIRPSFALIDDPQDRESANSESQCRTREQIIAGDVLYMSGPGQKMSAVMPCTVIRRGDMADELLNRQKHPDWNGERTKMLVTLPADQAALDRYAEVRGQALRGERPARDINRHWRRNRAALEAGALVAWPQRKNPDDVSAIQHAVNLMLRDRGAFFAEYQNEPLEETINAERLPTADEICAKLSHVERGELAPEWQHVTAFVDVQKEALFWCCCGWADNFGGGVIDYGCFPDQGRNYFSYQNGGGLSATLSGTFPGKPLEAVLFAGLTALTQELFAREWKRQDGAVLRLEKLLIDEGYATETVHQFCRWSPHSALIVPSKGWGVTAGNKPLNEYQRRPGEPAPGSNWRMTVIDGKSHVRHVLVDTNHWKSFVFARLATAPGAAGCLQLFGRDPARHRLFADHLCAEYTVKTHGRGRDVIEWKQKPGRPDNHWLDCLVGCAVGASMIGATLINSPTRRRPKLAVNFG